MLTSDVPSFVKKDVYGKSKKKKVVPKKKLRKAKK